MDYGYATTSYGAQGGADGGGFMPGSQSESPNAKRSYGKDTLRPVTIKQLIDAHHPGDQDYVIIDGAEATQVTFVGQVRNISQQATNVTYKVDDGTGIIEVKLWTDADQMNDPDHPANLKPKPTEQSYCRVWGRMKMFGNKRHVGANVIRPIQDYNEVQYHLLEATAVHLHFTKGPLESLQAKGGANGTTNGGMIAQTGFGDDTAVAGLSTSAKRVYKCLKDTAQTNEGLHMQVVASTIGMEINEVYQAGQDLMNIGAIYSTVDEQTWAVLNT